MSRSQIPPNNNSDDWLSYQISNKSLFFKIPPNQTKDSYLTYIDKRIKNNHRPSIPVIIQQIRVIDEHSIDEDENENHTND